ncbi:MAG: 30S ribosomal protein S16 [Cytophagia bacterium]|nr:MAG: 30S ribosomal protein S16 [Cytophagia bacterium]TAG41487.1 MAG: 30S ribosomal protein S16 [Cytophagia bacterium]
MVKIRLARRGRKKLAIYDIVVADARSPRDGRFIEKIGNYNPTTNPATIVLNEDKALKWLLDGAEPTPTMKAMLSYRGVLVRKHLQIGVIKKAITQEQADAKYAAWKEVKDAKLQGKVDKLATEKATSAKSRLDAERKVSEARAEALRKKQEEATQTLIAEIKEAATEGTDATDAVAE